MPKPIIAAFDFDGTVTTRDSLPLFLFYISGFWPTVKKLLLLSPTFLGYLSCLVPRQKTKETVLSHFFSGYSIRDMHAFGKEFASSSCLQHIVRPSALKKIQWHLQQGHRCILISAAIDVYIEPWAKKVGFHNSIASRLEVMSSGVITGRLEGLNCWGSEKTRRLIELVGPRENFVLYAYGDSRGDRDLLAMADYPFYRKMQ